MKIRAILLATSAITFVGLPASAEGADQWAGFYGGLGYNLSASGKLEEHTALYDTDSDAGKPLEFFAGHNWVRNNTVFGLEVSTGPGEIWEEGDEFYGMNSMMDVRARIGHGSDAWLVYGFLSAGVGDYWHGDEFDTASTSSFGAGIGAAYLVNPNIFIGTELALRRHDTTEDLSGKGKGGGAWNENGADIRTLSVKVGFLF